VCAELLEPKFQAKLLAFAHLHLNMFEIVLAEAPNPEASNPEQSHERMAQGFG
jgi:hypothetical protein